MEWLYEDKESMDIERRSKLPKERFFQSNEALEEERRQEVKDASRGESVLVLSDEDADGLGVALAVQEKHPEAVFIPCGPHTNEIDLEEVLEIVTEEMERNGIVYVGDICPDDLDAVTPLEKLAGKASEIYWWDHHEWNAGVQEYVEDTVTKLVLDSTEEREERCAAQIAYDELTKQDVNFKETVTETIEVTAVYDLWKKVTDDNGNETSEFIDERARDLNDFVSVVESYQNYFETVREYGPNVLQDSDVQTKVSEHRVEEKSLKALAVSRATFTEVGEYSVALTYGRCPQNDVSDELKEKGADLVVVVKPSGGVSFRGKDGGYTNCHKLADNFDGGGHEKAAGGFIAPKNDEDYDRWETDMLDYSDHWLNEGEKSRNRIVNVLEEQLEDES